MRCKNDGIPRKESEETTVERRNWRNSYLFGLFRGSRFGSAVSPFKRVHINVGGSRYRRSRTILISTGTLIMFRVWLIYGVRRGGPGPGFAFFRVFCWRLLRSRGHNRTVYFIRINTITCDHSRVITRGERYAIGGSRCSGGNTSVLVWGGVTTGFSGLSGRSVTAFNVFREFRVNKILFFSPGRRRSALCRKRDIVDGFYCANTWSCTGLRAYGCVGLALTTARFSSPRTLSLGDICRRGTSLTCLRLRNFSSDVVSLCFVLGARIRAVVFSGDWFVRGDSFYVETFSLRNKTDTPVELLNTRQLLFLNGDK